MSQRKKPHTPAFWDALVRRGVTPEAVAPYIPALSELEIAAEMIAARKRVDDQEAERHLKARILSRVPPHMRLGSGFGNRVGAAPRGVSDGV